MDAVSSRPNRVTIVGAGPGGLATALLLAGAGLQVTVLERLPTVGGRTSTLRLGDFRFDLGPTFFLYPQVLRQIFAAAGADLDDEVDLIRLDPQYRLVFGAGGELNATPDVETMERAVAALSPRDAPALRRFLADNREKFERFRPCLESPFQSWRDVANRRMLALLPHLKPWRSLDAELGSYFADPRIRLAFSFQSKYLGMSPFRCPSLFSILSFLEYEHGVFHPVGGCGAVTAAMARVARRLGVDVRLGEPVRELLFEGRRVVGARTDRGVYRSDAIVLNADFARAMQRLVPDRLRRRWSDRALARKKFSCSTFMLYLGIDGIYENLPHHSIYIAADYEKNLDEIENRGVLSADPSFYVQNAGPTDPSLAPLGASTLYVLVPVPHQRPGIDWRVEAPRMRRLALSQIEKAGFTGVERRIRVERCVTPDDWDSGLEIHRGATFNLAHSLDQMLHLRPRNRFDELESVYLVGGGTHPGSGLPVIFQSALISARLLLEDLGHSVDWTVDRAQAALQQPADELVPELAEAV
jgi:phytoene desaturase